ncbi:fibronectin type III domain-containing protein [Halomicrobium salinisoli]|uniref:fibronectin type III domain-containing protein n=1 Tax=Halomicrobium salinisoli TaxID=2878391 RepID=UPI001CF0C33D|nr:fibronectin type III domain-containing protein [Halomicrobium salinisoli]
MSEQPHDDREESAPNRSRPFDADRRDFMKLVGGHALAGAVGTAALSGPAAAVETASEISPGDGFTEVAPWLEEEDVDVYRIREPTRSEVEAAFHASGARVVVFETSGTIDLGGEELAITEDRCWVAGQTAPSPGITFVRGMLQVDANDCVVQHVRSRIGPGSDGNIQGNDSINTADGTENNVLDHVTASWGTDECLSVGYDTDNTTVTNCLVYEGLYDPYGDGSDHNYATLVGDGATNVTLAGNVWAKCRARLPRLKSETRSVVANNVMYFFNEATKLDGDTEAAVVGNAFIPQDLDDTVVDDGAAYFEDNVTEPESTPLTGGTERLSSPPLWPDGFDALSADGVVEHNLGNAGARPADRTANDERVVQEIRDREGDAYTDSPYDYWIPRPDAVGGYPDLPVNTHALDVPDSGLRQWLSEWAAEVEGGSVPDDSPTPTPSEPDETAPSTPTGLTVTDTTTSSISVEWDAASDRGGSGVDEYHVVYDIIHDGPDSDLGMTSRIVPAGTTSVTLEQVDSDTEYEITVSAVDGAGNESGAARVTASTDSEGTVEDRTGGRGPITVRGAGADVWNEADAFHYYYGQTGGDFDVAVRVDSVEETDEYAKAGLMVRESLDPGATNAMVRRRPSSTGVQWRTSADSATESTTSDEGESESEVSGGTTDHAWQRLVRSGDAIRAYSSPDGVEWTLLADLSLSLSDDVYVGLAVTSHAEGTLCTAEFDSLSGLQLTGNGDVGDVDAAGGVEDGGGPDHSPLPEVDGVEVGDPDGDGLYEDLNGNGEVDYDDVVTYFENMDGEAMTNDVEYFDYNGNGHVDFADLVELFGEV